MLQETPTITVVIADCLLGVVMVLAFLRGVIIMVVRSVIVVVIVVCCL